LDTVRMLLDVLEEVTMGISTIDAEWYFDRCSLLLALFYIALIMIFC